MSYSELPATRIAGAGKINLPGYGELKVSGSAHIGPGEISASGSSVIPGGLYLKSLKARGSTRMSGSINADKVWLGGSAHIDGALECLKLHKSGSLTVNKELRVGRAELGGATRVGGRCLVGEEFESRGSSIIGGDLVSKGRILYSGVLRVEGAVRAGYFEAHLSQGESFIRGGINADIINIQRSHSDWRRKGLLYTTDIVGDEVTLENVECSSVKGRDVRIKGGCHIKGLVYYSEVIRIDPDSVLDKEPEKIE